MARDRARVKTQYTSSSPSPFIRDGLYRTSSYLRLSRTMRRCIPLRRIQVPPRTGTTACIVPHTTSPAFLVMCAVWHSLALSYLSMLIMASRPVVYKPTWWHPTFASRTAQAPAAPNKPYPLDAGHLSGMGDSDCAEGACRIARLSLLLRAPVSDVLNLECNVGSWKEHSQYYEGVKDVDKHAYVWAWFRRKAQKFSVASRIVELSTRSSSSYGERDSDLPLTARTRCVFAFGKSNAIITRVFRPLATA
ncbi:hypothetical protein C8Q74DRAFT_1381887 [Fomes fomentarius]|nr:hypothetical protein C8Q74DRAFT_1381887 [Fomes fomentarius]